MNSFKKLIIIITVICIILIVILLAILMQKKVNVEEEYVDPPTSSEEKLAEEEMNKEVKIVEAEADFFTIEKQIKNFLLYTKVGNQSAIYQILDNIYVKENKITESNGADVIKEKYKSYEKEFSIETVYVQDSITKPIYYAYGMFEDKTELFATVYWDQTNIAFSIKPITKEEYEKHIKGETKEENNKTVETKEYNKLEKVTLTDEEKATKYFEDYIQTAIYHMQDAYSLIDKTYRENKFPNLQDYQTYLISKKQQLLGLDTKHIRQPENFKTEEEYQNYLSSLQFEGITKYAFENTQNGKQCTCIDGYGNYYIFQINGAMQYTVILDTYTIDLPEFLKKYQTANDEQKVLLNIQKFFSAIDNNDYKYAYNKLDETYRNNNFKTQEEFETYVKQTFYEQNLLKAGKVEKQDDIYLYSITISDATGKNNERITKTFVMQLKEGTDFVMSFSK